MIIKHLKIFITKFKNVCEIKLNKEIQFYFRGKYHHFTIPKFKGYRDFLL